MVNLSAREVHFRLLTDGFDTSTSSGRLLFHILVAVAELVRERTMAGIAATRAKGGAPGGRKPAMNPDMLETVQKLMAAGDPARKAGQIVECRPFCVLSLLSGKPAGEGLITPNNVW